MRTSSFRLSLYCKTGSSYSSLLPDLSKVLESLKAKWGTDFRIIHEESLTEDSERQLKMSMRSVPPQKRGDLVTSRGNMLPLSASKNLNVENTPILLVEKDGVPVDVYPKRIEDHYMGVREGLLQMLEKGIEVEEVLRSPEDLARKRLAVNPTFIETGLVLVGEEVPVQAGKIDILLKDTINQFLVVELKRAASDAAIGQVLRLSASVAKQECIALASVRKMIICARINSHVEMAASSVNIEVRTTPELFLPEDPMKNHEKDRIRARP